MGKSVNFNGERGHSIGLEKYGSNFITGMAIMGRGDAGMTIDGRIAGCLVS